MKLIDITEVPEPGSILFSLNTKAYWLVLSSRRDTTSHVKKMIIILWGLNTMTQNWIWPTINDDGTLDCANNRWKRVIEDDDV